jgi:hypothetical protein
MLANWHIDKTKSWQNVKLTIPQFGKLSLSPNPKAGKCHVGKMSDWQNVMLAH